MLREPMTSEPANKVSPGTSKNMESSGSETETVVSKVRLTLKVLVKVSLVRVASSAESSERVIFPSTRNPRGTSFCSDWKLEKETLALLRSCKSTGSSFKNACPLGLDPTTLKKARSRSNTLTSWARTKTSVPSAAIKKLPEVLPVVKGVEKSSATPSALITDKLLASNRTSSGDDDNDDDDDDWSVTSSGPNGINAPMRDPLMGRSEETASK
mmetsp:Transcript_14848/g.30317  ORF Transcript_14848/g.30317 Transcript_14848/m.30317 type:complete len:213 (-) Transcript_14848:3517-4155(-)